MSQQLLQLKNNILNETFELSISKEIGYYNYFDYKIEYINNYEYKVILYYHKIIPFYISNLPNDIIREIIKFSKEYFKFEFNIFLDNNYPFVSNLIYIYNIHSNYIHNFINIISNFKKNNKLKNTNTIENIIFNIHNEIDIYV